MDHAVSSMEREGYECTVYRDSMLFVQVPGKPPSFSATLGKRDYIACRYDFSPLLPDGLGRHCVDFVLNEQDEVVEVYEVYDR